VVGGSWELPALLSSRSKKRRRLDGVSTVSDVRWHQGICFPFWLWRQRLSEYIFSVWTVEIRLRRFYRPLLQLFSEFLCCTTKHYWLKKCFSSGSLHGCINNHLVLDSLLRFSSVFWCGWKTNEPKNSDFKFSATPGLSFDVLILCLILCPCALSISSRCPLEALISSLFNTVNCLVYVFIGFPFFSLRCRTWI
jgi:hypothetical protein